MTTHRVVLDTNILLDLLYFKDPSIKSLQEGIETGLLEVWSCEAIFEEYTDVIGREQFKMSTEEQENLSQAFQKLHEGTFTNPLKSAPFKCSDKDDQIFLDLALSLAPCILISKDKQVLKLKSAAKVFDVFILRQFEM